MSNRRERRVATLRLKEIRKRNVAVMAGMGEVREKSSLLGKIAPQNEMEAPAPSIEALRTLDQRSIKKMQRELKKINKSLERELESTRKIFKG